MNEDALAYAAEQFVIISRYAEAEKLIENGACSVLAIALAGRYAPEVCPRLVDAESRYFKSAYQKDPATWWAVREDMIAKMRARGRDEATIAWELKNFGYSLDVAE